MDARGELVLFGVVALGLVILGAVLPLLVPSWPGDWVTAVATAGWLLVIGGYAVWVWRTGRWSKRY